MKDTHIERIIEIEIIMAIEMSPHEIINLTLRRLMQILELMHRLELDHIQPIGKDTIRFPLQQMLRFVRGNMRHRRKHIRTMRRRTFYAIPMIDPALARLMIDIKVLKVVVEIDGTGTEVSTEESSVGCEDCRNVDVALSAEGDSEASLPFVEMGDNGLVESSRNVLFAKYRQYNEGLGRGGWRKKSDL